MNTKLKKKWIRSLWTSIGIQPWIFVLPASWYSSILPQKCMKLIDLQSQRKFRYFRWSSCNPFNCYKQINKKNLFFYIFEPKSSFHHIFPRSRLESMFYHNPYPKYNFSYYYKQISWSNSMNRRRWIHKIPFFLPDHQFSLRKWCFD